MKKIWLLCGVLSVCGGSVWGHTTAGLTDENNGSVATRTSLETPATINVTNPLFEGRLGDGQDFMAFGAHMRGRLEAFEEEKETEKAAGVARRRVSMPLTYSEYWTYLGGAKRALEKKVADVGVGTEGMYDLLQTITNVSKNNGGKNENERTLETALDLQVQTWEVLCDSERPSKGRVKACDEHAQSRAALTDAPDAVQHKLAFAYDKGFIPMLFFGEALFDLKAMGRTWHHGYMALSAANPVDATGNPIPVHGETVSRKGHFYHDLYHMNSTVAYPNTLNKKQKTFLWDIAEVDDTLVGPFFLFAHDFPDCQRALPESATFDIQALHSLVLNVFKRAEYRMRELSFWNKVLFWKEGCECYNMIQPLLASFAFPHKALPFDPRDPKKNTQQMQTDWNMNTYEVLRVINKCEPDIPTLLNGHRSGDVLYEKLEQALKKLPPEAAQEIKKGVPF